MERERADTLVVAADPSTSDFPRLLTAYDIVIHVTATGKDPDAILASAVSQDPRRSLAGIDHLVRDVRTGHFKRRRSPPAESGQRIHMTAAPDEDLTATAATMRARRLRQIAIVNHGEIVGLLTAGDVVAAG